jgi:hypothetical protein
MGDLAHLSRQRLLGVGRCCQQAKERMHDDAEGWPHHSRPLAVECGGVRTPGRSALPEHPLLREPPLAAVRG